MSNSQKNRLKWKGFNYSPKDHHLPPIFAVLIDLYDGKDVYEELESCRINPDYTSNKELRNDLEFYIPQLTNFMVFHEDFAKDKLSVFLEEWSKADPYFAHLYYWYINSLAPEIDQTRGQEAINHILDQGNEERFQTLNSAYDNFEQVLRQKYSPTEYEAKMEISQRRKTEAEDLIRLYKSTEEKFPTKKFIMRASDINLKSYASPFLQDNESVCFSNSFTSTILFFEDLCFASNEIIKEKKRLEALKRLLSLINNALWPSYAYVPFVKDSIRHCKVLNIVVEETKVFSTKERAPFYICLELFMPQEELAYEYQEYFQTKNKENEGNAKQKKKNGVFQARTDYNIKNAILDPNEEGKLDRQFRIGGLHEIVSFPMTLKTARGTPHDSPNSRAIDKMHRSLLSRKTITNGINNDMTHLEESKEVEKQAFMLSISSNSRRENLSQNFTSEDIDEFAVGQRQLSQEGSASDLNQFQPKSTRTSLTNLRMIHRKSPLSEIIIRNRDSENGLLNAAEEEKLIEVSKEDDSEPASVKHIDVVKGEESSSEDFFGEDSEVQAARIRNSSPFGTFKTWRLVHLIIKSGADMKEEQFAIQLISKFEHIFKMENLKLLLSPYEILSLGENVGVVEVVKDSVTFSKLKEKMLEQTIPNLSAFFEKFYGKKVEDARKRFCYSLAAYSLVCYFLQIKDRHNGNIMLHKKGHIVHIDFGFFLSNSPGKGLEFERKIPFKLLNEYVEVLGGPRSKLFQKFRKYFYKGFLAARKHREQILILVKMIYSTHSQSFPCFKAGMKTITDLEQRFNPPGVNENDLKDYCYNLINQSLDNWRAKCYDKYQYYFQGILY